MRASGLILVLFALAGSLAANQKPAKIDDYGRALLIRELVAERGTSTLLIPRSNNALDIALDGGYDADQWQAAMLKNGPAARKGDLVEITKLEFKGKRLVLELNHGIKGGRRWWHRVEVSSGGSRGGHLGANEQVYAPGGTKLALVFDSDVPPITSDEVKEKLKPFLEFTDLSVTELYIESLPQEYQDAIKQERAMEGMDRDMVLLARGRPDNKYRDFKDGVETEDWIYGMPPGNITFVTFEDGKVIRIRDSYAHVGGEIRTEEIIKQESLEKQLGQERQD
jgi:hypothetical protein